MLKKITLILLVILIVIGCSGCTPIIRFYPELVAMLREKYDLNIPEDAEFISGYYDNQPQDDWFHLTVKIPKEKFGSLFGDGWSEVVADDPMGIRNEHIAGTKEHKKSGESLTYDNTVDGKIEMRFSAMRPPATRDAFVWDRFWIAMLIVGCFLIILLAKWKKSHRFRKIAPPEGSGWPDNKVLRGFFGTTENDTHMP